MNNYVLGKALKISVAVSFVFMLLPWFSFNTKVAGLHYGIDVLEYAWAPFVIILMYLFLWEKDKKVYVLLTEAALFSLIGLHIYEFMYWQCSITGGVVNISLSLRTALPTFWLSFAAICITWVIFQLYFIKMLIGRVGTVKRLG